jgi:hypothetical protein
MNIKIVDRVSGRIAGITLASFLQMLHAERRSCQIMITSNGRRGFLLVIDGEIASASYETMEAEAAVYELVTWEEVELQIAAAPAGTHPRLNLSLEHILMEAARLADEQRWPDGTVSPALNKLLEPAVDQTDGWNIETSKQTKETQMDNLQEILGEAMSIDGAMGVALVAVNSGMALGKAGGAANFDLDVAAAGNTAVVKAKLRVMSDLGLRNEKIEDILITLGTQYHLIRLLGSDDSLFLYLVLNRNTANLAMARHKLAVIERKVII